MLVPQPLFAVQVLLACAVILASLSLGSAHTNTSYADSLVYRPPGTNTTTTTGTNEISLGEEIVLSFLRRFIGPEKVKKSKKPGLFENIKTLVKNVEDLLSNEPQTHAIVNEIPLSRRRPETNAIKTPETGRGKMTDMMFSPYMLIPQLIMLGFSPIVLANLKMFVMQTLMMNQMAFSAALWMTIRNMVFGPSPEPPVKYYNFGYEKPHHVHNPHGHHSSRRRSAPSAGVPGPGRRRIDK